MACKLIKKGLIGAALGAGALALLFGTAAPSYVKTAFHKVRHNAKYAVPIQFEIDRARQQVADLTPAIRDNMENLARAEEDVKELRVEIASITDNREKEKRTIVALRDSLASGDFRLAGAVSYTPEEVKTELRRRLDHYHQVKNILTNKEDALKAKEKGVLAAREMLSNVNAERRALLTKIEEIDAKHKSIEANRTYNEFNFDDSALANVKKTVSELERRLNIEARTSDLESRFAEQNTPLIIEPAGDVLKDIDSEFGHNSSGVSTAQAGDKSL